MKTVTIASGTNYRICLFFVRTRIYRKEQWPDFHSIARLRFLKARCCHQPQKDFRRPAAKITALVVQLLYLEPAFLLDPEVGNGQARQVTIRGCADMLKVSADQSHSGTIRMLKLIIAEDPKIFFQLHSTGFSKKYVPQQEECL
ncbi:MAG: hypothetical protein JXD23_02375 [Spirochaetales bacterium]|nr:hypothetical protein [Spirochaetales bacterium]